MTFPTCGILDNFNRTNEGPPPSASWNTGSTDSFKVVSNTCVPNEAYGSGNYWLTSLGPDIEAYITIKTALNANADYFTLGVRTTDGATPIETGYVIRYTKLAGTDTLVLGRIDSSVLTALATYNQEISANDSIGISAIGNILTAYYKASGGSWTTLGTYDITSDATKYTTAGYIAINDYEITNAIVLDDFGGGTVVAGETFLTGVHFYDF
jgi:hypothetical protein